MEVTYILEDGTPIQVHTTDKSIAAKLSDAVHQRLGTSSEQAVYLPAVADRLRALDVVEVFDRDGAAYQEMRELTRTVDGTTYGYQHLLITSNGTFIPRAGTRGATIDDLRNANVQPARAIAA